ncbi:uncharacterized protein LOC125814031 [Solanum verrucosum]|uniref:uncharacterized protein LOC125814031 n=1 Tax=Solanum verrucosum TaxID=315347 RepID=UPI0020D09162|nr:uncharacterized protein LOC125814031 [Solanum verrucosum]
MTISSQVNAGTVSAATTSVAHNCSTATLAPAKKPAKFSGVDFKRWQQKKFFCLTTLKKKYKTEDAGMKKFILAKFLDYKMIDSKTVVTQVQELQVIIHGLLTEGLVVNDAFQVAAIIGKLPPLWKDFKNYLKHKHKKMTVKDLMKRKEAIGPKSNPPKKKFNGSCFNCGKRGHRATECRGPKKDKKKDQANLDESKGEMDDLCAMLSQCNLVRNPSERWIYFGASCHGCANKELFSSYTPAPTDEKLFMANSIVTKVEGTGKVLLKMTSGKVVTLNRVSYVRELRKFLVYIPVVTKNGFRCVFVSDKVVEVIACLYVDDMLIMSKYIANVKATKRMLARYSDANWITGSTETKSTSGYVFTIGGGAISCLDNV